MHQIPINFSAQQEGGLTKALKQAGLSSIRYIPEPCAAALVAVVAEFNANTALENLRVLVIDLGGGTLDVAAVDINRSTGLLLDVAAVDGDPELSGIEYDAAVARCIETELASRGIPTEHISRATLMAEAERAKIVLNHENSVSVVFNTFEVDIAESREIVVILKRDQVLERFRELDDRVVARIMSLFSRDKWVDHVFEGLMV